MWGRQAATLLPCSPVSAAHCSQRRLVKVQSVCCAQALASCLCMCVCTWGSFNSCTAAKLSCGLAFSFFACFLTVAMTRFSLACFFFLLDLVPCSQTEPSLVLKARFQNIPPWHARSSLWCKLCLDKRRYPFVQQHVESTMQGQTGPNFSQGLRLPKLRQS